MTTDHTFTLTQPSALSYTYTDHDSVIFRLNIGPLAYELEGATLTEAVAKLCLCIFRSEAIAVGFFHYLCHVLEISELEREGYFGEGCRLEIAKFKASIKYIQ